MNISKIIVAITGASGYRYGVVALKILKDAGVDVHLILSKSSELTRIVETDYCLEDVKSLAAVVHHANEVSACISSGSCDISSMLVAPCSMKTLAEIAAGISGNLISRTADVMLKERKPLVLMTRETPLNLIHIENMKQVTLAGGVIMPPVPSLYTNATSIEEIIEYTAIRAIDSLGIRVQSDNRWLGLRELKR